MLSLKKIITTFVLSSFIFFAFFGLNIHGAMVNDGHGMMKMSDCPYMEGGSAMCPMNLFSHIQAWQNSMRATPVENVLFLLVVIFVFLILYNTFSRELEWLYQEYSPTKTRLYEKLWFQYSLLLSTYLFSQGILNPKLY